MKRGEIASTLRRCAVPEKVQIAGLPCRRLLPKETVATCDTGAHRILLAQMWQSYGPRTLLQSTGLCTMGCALPLALGAQLAEPERPVVAFAGDGGLLMVAGELSTAAELGSRVIVVVFVDASLALIELKQRQRQLGNAGVDFARHDFAAVARAFGGVGHTVTNRAELEAALDDALNALARVDERFTRIMELRYFAGYTLPEIAELSGRSLASVKRDWAYARAWLYDYMSA